MADHVHGFSSPVAARLAGVTFGQLDRWARTAIATPSIADSDRSGKYRRWSFTDLVGLRVLKSLLEDGLPLARVRRILPALRDFTQESHNLKALAQSRLVVLGDGDIVAIAMDTHRLMELFPKHGQLLVASLVIDLQPAVAEVQREMKAQGLDDEIQELRGAGAWILTELAS